MGSFGFLKINSFSPESSSTKSTVILVTSSRLIGETMISIPSELMSGSFSIYKDDVLLAENVDYTETYNGTHYMFSLTYQQSTHAIEIFSTTVIPELTSIALLLTFIISTIAVITVNRRKKR